MSSPADTVLCFTMNPSEDVSTHTERVVPAGDWLVSHLQATG